jgi:hypothetical protein
MAFRSPTTLVKQKYGQVLSSQRTTRRMFQSSAKVVLQLRLINNVVSAGYCTVNDALAAMPLHPGLPSNAWFLMMIPRWYYDRGNSSRTEV